MTNAMALKTQINKQAKVWGIPPQSVMNTYMTERLLERVSQSSYAPHIVVKGGFLIASVIGAGSRATMDLDATLQGWPLRRDVLEEMLAKLVAIDVEDAVEFEVLRISDIRRTDEYEGFRISFAATFQGMRFPVKLDLTAGDAITPSAIRYQYPLMFSDKCLDIMAYNLETILAEKLETVLRRGDQNTRARDFYDLHVLYRQFKMQISVDTLNEAMLATALRRGSERNILVAAATLSIVKTSVELKTLWDEYSQIYDYARGISYDEVCATIDEMCSVLNIL